MGTFPPSVSPVGTGPQAGAASPGGPGPAAGVPSGPMKLAMLGQLIQGMAKDFPAGAEAIQQMMQGLRQLQGIAQAQSAPPQPAAPPQ